MNRKLAAVVLAGFLTMIGVAAYQGLNPAPPTAAKMAQKKQANETAKAVRQLRDACIQKFGFNSHDADGELTGRSTRGWDDLTEREKNLVAGCGVATLEKIKDEKFREEYGLPKAK